MYINLVLPSCVLVCMFSIVKPWHITPRPMAQFKQQFPPPGVFRAGKVPYQWGSRGKVYTFTNPPPIPTTTTQPPTTTTPTTTTPRPTTPAPTKPFDWVAYFATTFPSTKKGRCPDFDVVHAGCYGRCHKDDDCFYERKCCRDGYGFGCCTDPVQPGFFDSFFGGPTTSSYFFGGGPTTSSFFFKKK